MTTAASFPSTQWFELLAGRMNEQRAKYQNFGFVSARAVFRILDTPGGNRNFGLVFDGLECVEIRELADSEIASFDPDWTLDGNHATWKEMVENIKAHGEAAAALGAVATAMPAAAVNQFSAQQTNRIAMRPPDPLSEWRRGAYLSALQAPIRIGAAHAGDTRSILLGRKRPPNHTR